MQTESNASRPKGEARGGGFLLGACGVLGFSFSLPASKLAIADLNPWVVSFGRAAIAAVLAATVLLATRAPRPTATQWRRLGIVAGGVVFGFPVFSTLALTTSGPAHGAVIIALLPAATAAVAVLRGGERPGPVFWLAALAGLAVVAGYSLARSGGSLGAADLLFLLATLTCAFGYAEGGALARELGGARTICWALILSAPVSITGTAIAAAGSGLHAGTDAWLGFAYVSLVSMFVGFFAWYAGLARGGVARISQVQLAQPLLTIGWAALVLGEAVAGATVYAAVGVLACVVITQRARVSHRAAVTGQGPSFTEPSSPSVQ